MNMLLIASNSTAQFNLNTCSYVGTCHDVCACMFITSKPLKFIMYIHPYKPIFGMHFLASEHM